jgi:hypothetical protein
MRARGLGSGVLLKGQCVLASTADVQHHAPQRADRRDQCLGCEDYAKPRERIVTDNARLRYPPQYFSSICGCGHAFADHHLGFILNEDVLRDLPAGHPPYRMQECEYYDCNEGGGMGPDGYDHCHRYIDRGDPVAPTHGEPGTFTRRARAWACARCLAQLVMALTTGKKFGYVRAPRPSPDD